MKTERFWKITEFGNSYSCYVEENDGETLVSFLDGAEVGHGASVEIVKMSRSKFEKLPEYEG